MNTRLVWNFEINQTNSLNLNELKDERDELRWELRYFWPDNTIICLNGLDSRFLNLSNYEAKHREDCYALLNDLDYNIKQRRMQWLYKPLLAEKGPLRGYGKKINLEEFPASEPIAGSHALNSRELLSKIANSKHRIELVKEALIFKFPSEPTIKLELARLELKEKIYFSLCIEGRSPRLVSKLAKHLLGTQVSCDYVSFLKQTLTP